MFTKVSKPARTPKQRMVVCLSSPSCMAPPVLLSQTWELFTDGVVQPHCHSTCIYMTDKLQQLWLVT